jgi:methyl-accepting chemotaxis protein
VEEIVAAIQHMSKSSNELTKVMQAVNTVTEENNTATMALASGSNEVTRSAENIASISEENSAAVEEVSAAAEEVSAQVEQVSASAASLMNMAQELQQVISRFKLNKVEKNHVTMQDKLLAIATQEHGNFKNQGGAINKKRP